MSTSLAPQAETRTASQNHLTNDALHFAPDQHVALYIIDHARSATAAYQGDLHTMTTAEGDVLCFDFGSNCYWPGNSSVDFYAWYPYKAGGPFDAKKSSDTTVFPVSTDQRTEASYAACDLMCAKTENVSRPAVAGTRINMNFTHALSQVIVVLQSTNDQLTASQLETAQITLDGTELAPLYMDANVDIDAGTATALTTGTIATQVQLGTGITTFAVLPPGQSLTGKAIHFTLDGIATKSYNITSIGELQAGKKYTITLNLTLSTFNVTETVVDWLTGGDDRDESSNPLYF